MIIIHHIIRVSLDQKKNLGPLSV